LHAENLPVNRAPQYGWKFAALIVLLCMGTSVACAFLGAKSLLLVGGLVAVCGFLVLVVQFPETLLVVCAFMPQWKTSYPLSQLGGGVDPTLVLLAGLLLLMGKQLLLHFSGLERQTIPDLFRGQWWLLSLYAAFCAMVAVSYTYTSAPEYGGTKLLRLICIGTLLLLSGLVFVRDENSLRRFFRLFIACACITSLQLIFHLEKRVEGAEGDITRIGAGWLIGIGILLLLGYSYSRSKLISMLTIFACLPLLLAGLIASAARGPLIALLLFLPIWLFFFDKRTSFSTRVLVAAVLSVSCVGSFLYLRSRDPGKYNSKLNEIVSMSEGEHTTGSATKRLEFYAETLQAIPDNLWLGQGVGSWSVAFMGKDTRDYPHNLFLETTFEEGLTGQILLLIFLGAVGLAAYRVAKGSGFRYGVLLIVMMYCVTVTMFSGDLDDDRLIWFWAGIVIAVLRNMQPYYIVTRRVPARKRLAPRTAPVPAPQAVLSTPTTYGERV